MHLVVNALSTTNLSGAYVLTGYLRAMAGAADAGHRITVLIHKRNRFPRQAPANRAAWHMCSGPLHDWRVRRVWERLRLPGLLRTLKADALLMCSGTAISRCPTFQASLAMNPWCLVPRLRRRPAEHVKAALQRRAYRDAVRRVDLMIYLSEYLRDAYRENAGCDPGAAVVVYPPLANDVVATAGALRSPPRSCDLVCVSAMAPHKGIETALAALALVRTRFRLPATLTLVGGWPSHPYERQIRRRIAALGLTDAVEITGHVGRSDLLERSARARAFCLFSLAESFGIPGLEAQALGTPVVASHAGALPEVDGAGGLYVSPGDPPAAADALATVLRNDTRWRELSAAAAANARRFTLEETSRRLAPLFDRIALPGRPW